MSGWRWQGWRLPSARTALLWRGGPSLAEQPAQGSSDERMPVGGRVRRGRPVRGTHRFRKQPRQLRVRAREGGAYQRHAIVRRELRIVRARAGGVDPMLQLAPRRQSDVYDRRGRGKLQEAPQQPLKREAVLPSAAVLGVLDLVRVRVWVGARRVSYDLPPGPKLPP